MLLALTATPTLKLRLFSNNVSVGATTVLSDLTEASFAGYAPASPAWGAPGLSGTTAQIIPSPTNVDFSYSGGSTATVYGAYLTDAAGTALFGATTFATPFVFSTVVPVLKIYPVYTQKTEFTVS